MTRYALYYSPATQTPFWQLGCAWLGRDPTGAAPLPCPSVPGIAPPMMTTLTASARRYGFHATLKAPFRLAPGFGESDLLAMAQAFARVQRPIGLSGLKVNRLDDFLALCPAQPTPQLDALAMRVVAYFDPLRAAPTANELARRRRARLSPRQDALLERWGYPYTEEEFRFHMTLTDSLTTIDADVTVALEDAADAYFEAVTPTWIGSDTVDVDGLSIFKEAEPGAPFELLARIPFSGTGQGSSMPAPGRLIYIVGPSGVGKDSLLRWVKEHLGDRQRVRFATRAITRAAHPSEVHEPVALDDFWNEADAGGFSMIWQANGACYAVRRGIEADLLAGYDVVVNGSREHVPSVIEARPDAWIVWITAQPDIIARRLVARQRETGADLLHRVERAAAFSPPTNHNTIQIDNSGPIDVAGARLLDLLQD